MLFSLQFIDHDLTKITSGSDKLDVPVPKVCVFRSVKRAWRGGVLGVADVQVIRRHQLMLSVWSVCCIPQGDPQLDPTGTGTKVLPFTRSAFVRSVDGRDTREHINTITHFLDASMVSAFRLGSGHCTSTSCPLQPGL